MALGSKTVGVHRSVAVVQAAIRDRKPFRRGNVSGITGHGSPGWLQGDARETWERDRHSTVYTVYSYDTPIAWLVAPAGGPSWWRVPAVRYSVSTSGHQGVARVAIVAAGEEYTEHLVRPRP